MESIPASVSLADLYQLRIDKLKAESNATNRRIAEHLARAKQLIKDAQAIDVNFPEN
jgi:hypothetical protein